MSRAPAVDEHGVTHRHGCQLPGWLGGRPVIAGSTIATCAGCKAVRVVPVTTAARRPAGPNISQRSTA